MIGIEEKLTELVDELRRTYVHRHLGKFDELVNNQRKPLIEGESERAAEVLAEDYMRSECLVEMQKSWQEFHEKNL
ncbi:MAG: hypothetical protein ACI4P5_00020 [Candidatus Fimadaptatus sp.]